MPNNREFHNIVLLMTMLFLSSTRMTALTRAFAFGARGRMRRTPSAFKSSTPTTTTSASTAASSTRLFSSSSPSPPMPYPDDQMPFYALGMNVAMQVGGQGNLKTILEEDEIEVMLAAFSDTLRGQNAVDVKTVLASYGQQLNQILNDRQTKIIDRVKKDGEDYVKNFMDCNDDAEMLDSGMIYCEMTEGTGKQATASSTVEVHYHGTLTDGTVFDSSVDRGQTISFPLTGVIKGWQIGLQKMKEGGKATLVIPSDLAYGDQGSGEVIPPGATLKFEVELINVK